jgi:hypothetical protein
MKLVKLRLEDISVEDDSGWRGKIPGRVEELVDLFRSGGFGQTTLALPSLLGSLLASDGRRKLANGKSCVTALQALAADPHKDTSDWCTGPLKTVLEEGLECSVTDLEPSANFCAQAIAHDEGSNKYAQTSLQIKLDLGARGLNALLDLFGKSKKSVCARWAAASKAMSKEVVLLADSLAGLPHKLVLENKYFVGDQKTRLGTELQRRALELLADKLAADIAVPFATFVENYCLPLKSLEIFQSQCIKQYGQEIVSAHTPLRTLLQQLSLDNGRQRVIQSLANGGKISDIPEARLILKDLSERQRTSAVAAGAAAAGAADGAAAAAGDAVALDVAMDLGVPMSEGAVEDPVRAKASDLANFMLASAAMHSQLNDLIVDLKTKICAGRWVLVVDAPTSKAKVIIGYLKAAASFPSKP